MNDKTYNTGPFKTDSPVHKFLVAQEVNVTERIMERYGLCWVAELTEEQATIFRLRFPNRQFWTEEDFRE